MSIFKSIINAFSSKKPSSNVSSTGRQTLSKEEFQDICFKAGLDGGSHSQTPIMVKCVSDSALEMSKRFHQRDLQGNFLEVYIFNMFLLTEAILLNWGQNTMGELLLDEFHLAINNYFINDHLLKSEEVVEPEKYFAFMNHTTRDRYQEYGLYFKDELAKTFKEMIANPGCIPQFNNTIKALLKNVVIGKGEYNHEEIIILLNYIIIGVFNSFTNEFKKES